MRQKMFKMAETMWPINRSLLGPGNRRTLHIIKKIQKNLKIYKIKSGTKVFDWIVPKEWHIKNAWIKMNGKIIVDFSKNNLHVVGYSKKIKKFCNFNELRKKIHFIEKKPNAIPYVTSYYKKDWGFCMSYNSFKKLNKNKRYELNIDSKFVSGNLNYGEVFFPGKTKKEILFSTYICHPSLANNEISGPVVNTFLSKYVEKFSNRYYSYRFIFIPETIGSISYLKKNLKTMKKNIVAGFNITCVGDEKNYSYIPSRMSNSFSDSIIKQTFRDLKLNYKSYSWLDRGSDERQFCSPGVDLPFCVFCRSKFGDYYEYHTSLDKLGKVVTNKGLEQSLKFLKKLINNIEKNITYSSKIFGEPFMTKYNLYNTTSNNTNSVKIKSIMNVISMCDGKMNINDISEKCQITKNEVNNILKILIEKKIISKTKI